MKSLSRHLLRLLSIALIMALCSCSSTKTAVKKNGSSRSSLTPTERVESMVKGYGKWKSAKIPVTLELRQPAQVSIGGTLTMVRDKDIHLSFRVPLINMEVLTLYVTTDSVFATFKPSKIYVEESIDNFFRDFPVTVGNVQDLLMGRIFVVGGGNLNASAARSLPLAESDDGDLIVSPPAVDGVGYHFKVDADDNVAQFAVTTRSGNLPAELLYKDVYVTDRGEIPSEVVALAALGGKRLDASLLMNLRRAEWNASTSRSWKRPAGYRRITAPQLVELLKNFKM